MQVFVLYGHSYVYYKYMYIIIILANSHVKEMTL